MPLRYLMRDQLLLKLGPLSPYAPQIIEQPETTRYPVDSPPSESVGADAGATDSAPTIASIGYYRYIFSRARNHIGISMTQAEYDELPSAPEADFDPPQRRSPSTLTVASEPLPTPITPMRVSKYAPRD